MKWVRIVFLFSMYFSENGSVLQADSPLFPRTDGVFPNNKVGIFADAMRIFLPCLLYLNLSPLYGQGNSFT